jgi:hypothetical protein
MSYAKLRCVFSNLHPSVLFDESVNFCSLPSVAARLDRTQRDVRVSAFKCFNPPSVAPAEISVHTTKLPTDVCS